MSTNIIVDMTSRMHNRKSTRVKKVATMPTEEELVAFNHVAAGHEGMSSNVTGDLVIKPCTQAEIDFYESARAYDDFQLIIPEYIGNLQVAKSQSSTVSLSNAQNGHTINPHHLRAPSLPLPVIAEVKASVDVPENLSSNSTTPTSTKRISWKPSGGKKLDTGLAIALENVAAGFKCPNILDVKLGARLWADDAHPSKKRKLDDVSKTTTSGTLGFRIAGMKLWHEAKDTSNPPATNGHFDLKDGYLSYSKEYGKSLTIQTVKSAFEAYFGVVGHNENGKLKFKHRKTRSVARRMSQRLRNIETILMTEESRMYSASILMVYEGDGDSLNIAFEDEQRREAEAVKLSEELGAHENPPGRQKVTISPEGPEEDEEGSDEDEEISPKIEDVRLIDFAHAQWTPGEGPDENALQGIRSVIRILDELTGDA